MTAPKRRTSDHDASRDPTRKVESMSSLVAELLVKQLDPDATSPAGIAAVRPDPDGAGTGAHADAAAIEMARLIEVESEIRPLRRAAPDVPSGAPGAAPASVRGAAWPVAPAATTSDVDVEAFTPRRRAMRSLRNALIVVAVLALVAMSAAVAFYAVR